MKDTYLGAFAVQNTKTGVISNCYSAFKRATPLKKMKCFCGLNEGKITHSVMGKHAEDEEQTLIDSEKKAAELGFSEKLWRYTGTNPALMYKEENWHVDTPAPEQVIHLSTYFDVNEFIDHVNAGDEAYRKAYVVLDNDIDMMRHHPKAPIGCDRDHAFSGTFDGQGYTISNFKLTSKNSEMAGFFGYLKGRVMNLTLDMQMTTQENAGGFVYCNEGSIYCSALVGSVRVKSSDASMGGFVCINHGKIQGCYSSGTVMVMPIPLFPILIAGLLLLFIGASAFYSSKEEKLSANIYNVVSADKNQIKDPVPTQDAQITQMPEPTGDPALSPTPTGKPNGMNTIGFVVDPVVNININKGLCSFYFANPVASTVRAVFAIEYLQMNGEYIEIARTGGVDPGYVLYNTVLSSQYDYEIEDGTYNGRVVVSGYDRKTGNKSIMKLEMPIVLKITNK